MVSREDYVPIIQRLGYWEQLLQMTRTSVMYVINFLALFTVVLFTRKVCALSEGTNYTMPVVLTLFILCTSYAICVYNHLYLFKKISLTHI